MKRSLSWKSSAWQCSYDLKSEMCVKSNFWHRAIFPLVDCVFGTNVPRPCRRCSDGNRNSFASCWWITVKYFCTASRDQFLVVVLKRRCRILFATCSRYEDCISLEAGELNSDTLLELVGKLFSKAEKKRDEIGRIASGLRAASSEITDIGVHCFPWQLDCQGSRLGNRTPPRQDHWALL